MCICCFYWLGLMWLCWGIFLNKKNIFSWHMMWALMLEFDLQSLIFGCCPSTANVSLSWKQNFFHKRRWWTIRRGVYYMWRTCCCVDHNVRMSSTRATQTDERKNLNTGQDGMKFSRSSTCGHIVDCVTHFFGLYLTPKYVLFHKKFYSCIKILSRMR